MTDKKSPIRRKSNSQISIYAKNFCVLQEFNWPLGNTTVLTGANGAGKTTALLAMKLIRAAYDRGLPDAVSITLGGSYNIRNHNAWDEEDPIELGIDIDKLSWRVRLLPHGSTVDYLTDEWLESDGKIIFKRDSLGNFKYKNENIQLSQPAAEQLGIKWINDNKPNDKNITQMASLIRNIQVFYDPDISFLRENGSRATEDRHMHSRGRNVFTMLRKWRDKKEDRPRFNFVEKGLQAAFPDAFSELDFEAGQTITARIYRPGDDTPNPINREANGILAMLIVLSEIAATHSGGIVAIDEPEFALHPFAIRRLIELACQWAEHNDIRVIFTTHSTVLLNTFSQYPEKIFVLEDGHNRNPVRLDELHPREWLDDYALGDLYSDGDFASNRKEK